ncbi:MAG: hypothetical protein J6Y02_24925 [Pseudobutyrivibrio sp.]|nr:hypothetical protein [Pseudobutyrivibrio sp.]
MEKVELKNVKIGYKNFSGRPSTYNVKGSRKFCVFLTDKQMAELKSLGCSVKTISDKDGVKHNVLIVGVICPSAKVLFSSLVLNIIIVKIRGQKDISIDLDKINVMDSLNVYGADLTVTIDGKYKLAYLLCGKFKVSKRVSVNDLFRAMEV